MDALEMLEKKVLSLLELIKNLKSENANLVEENKQLKGKIEELETLVLRDKDDLDQEKELTKMVVDGLIKNIDSLISNEKQHDA